MLKAKEDSAVIRLGQIWLLVIITSGHGLPGGSRPKENLPDFVLEGLLYFISQLLLKN